MAEQSIRCPHCGKSVPLSKALTAEIEEKSRKSFEKELERHKEKLECKYDEKLAEETQRIQVKTNESVALEVCDLRQQVAEKDKAIRIAREQELALRKRERALEENEQSLELQLAAKLEEGRREIEEKAEARIAEKQRLKELEREEQVADLRQQLTEKDEAIAKVRQQKLELLKRQRELEEKEKSIDLEVAKKVNEECQEIEHKTVTRLAEEHRLKDLEKDKKIADLTEQARELQRKAQQGSEQTQGEVAELELEELLRASFPDDEIEPVPIGIRGADVVQRIHARSGQHCGTIIWDSKNTKAWNETWISKIKDDQRELRAEIAVLASLALPKDIKHFAQIDGVWVTHLSLAVGVGTVLRSLLIELARARTIEDGKSTKKEILYAYFSGTEFKQRVEAIVEPFIAMQEDLQREKRAQEATWAKREKQIQRVIQGVTGMYGDVQGIIGKEMPRIEQLEVPCATSGLEMRISQNELPI